ncbi:MAG: response regulator [Defluviitaleaceae bacterium]|nr:response regulator [Defluviitaleaceae bacterium]
MVEAEKNRILIVDDEKSNLEILLSILGQEYTIYMTKNGFGAIDMAHKYLPDLILLDIIMPDTNGYEVLATLKASAVTKHIPVIFVTGLNSVEDEEKGFNMGAADFISKPFNSRIARSRVRNQIKIVNYANSMKRLYNELEAMAKTAETANRTKSSFLARMSHEIRTPLNAILGISEIQLQDNSLPLEKKQAFVKIYNSGDLLLGIINDILDLSKIEAGKQELNLARYSVTHLIKDTAHINTAKCAHKPIAFKLDIDENIPSHLYGDELRIKQIINNLLSNAFKYTKSGEVKMAVRAEAAGEAVILTFNVSDTGQGMTEEQVNTLFDEYTRFNMDANRTTEGTGLGMSIVQNLVRLMDGEITVQSELGKGTVFTVRFPQRGVGALPIGRETAENLAAFRFNAQEDPASPKIPREIMPYGHVLVVDDVETNLYVAKGFMDLFGIKTDTAMSGHEALEIVKRGNTYDIIFLDHMMPEMDGLEVIQQLRKMDYKAPVIALTANAITGQAEIFMQSGFDAFISKPIDIGKLTEILYTFIRDRQPPEVLERVRAYTNPPQGLDKALRESFIRDGKKALKHLGGLIRRDAFDTEDALRIFTVVVHGIKSSLAAIGEPVLSEAAEVLEEYGREKNTGAIKAAASDFTDRLRLLVYSLESL